MRKSNQAVEGLSADIAPSAMRWQPGASKVSFAESGLPPLTIPNDFTAALSPGTAIVADSGEDAGGASRVAVNRTPKAMFAACWNWSRLVASSVVNHCF